MTRSYALWAVVLLSLLTLLATPAAAEVEGPHVAFSLHGGKLFWTGGRPYDDDFVYGGRIALMPSTRFGVEGTLELHPTHDLVGETFRVTHMSANLLFQILPYHRINPYVTGGVTRLHSNKLGSSESNWDGWEAGGGVLLALARASGRRVDLRLDVRRTCTERTQAGPQDDNFPTNWIATAGLRFAFGGDEADGDQDGVPDHADDCPATPRQATVDRHGCPTDSDYDGVFDGLDLCPDTPEGAPVDAKGCPLDEDGDGVYDYQDQCPGTKEGVAVDAKGCALDEDKDGVPDAIDRCPGTPQGEQVDEWGCQVDSDGDGVSDSLDRCPGTPPNVAVDARGCPVPSSAREIELLDTGMLRLNNVNFASARAEITADSYPALREVAKILLKWPSLRIEIGGHTDSRGAAEFNQKLSEARAQSVFDWLIENFPRLKASQFLIRGYGESDPIAENSTAHGRALNRRVEFKVLNREILRKEHEPQPQPGGQGEGGGGRP